MRGSGGVRQLRIPRLFLMDAVHPREHAMSKTYRHQPDKPKPRDIKRQRQREAMLMRPSASAQVLLPEPEPPVWKPLG
jgi:hypothetical protein